jgi:hypothetical protein
MQEQRAMHQREMPLLPGGAKCQREHAIL